MYLFQTNQISLNTQIRQRLCQRDTVQNCGVMQHLLYHRTSIIQRGSFIVIKQTDP